MKTKILYRYIKRGILIKRLILFLLILKVNKFFKKNAPTGDMAEAIAAKITKFEGIKANAEQAVRDGKLSGQESKRLIAKAWDALQRWSESLAA